MDVRELQYEDVIDFEENISSYIAICFESTYKKYSEELVKEKIRSLRTNLKLDRAYSFGAFENGAMVGFLWAYQITSPEGASFHVAYIAVDAFARGKGVGRRLLSVAEDKAMKLGINNIELIVSTRNKKAIQFYTKDGYLEERYILKKKLLSE